METIYDDLITFDYPDSLTGGLRRTCDALRAVIERTRSDITLTHSQQELLAALRAAKILKCRWRPAGSPFVALATCRRSGRGTCLVRRQVASGTGSDLQTEEPGMDPGIVRQFRMERRPDQRTLPYSYDLPLKLREHLDARTLRGQFGARMKTPRTFSPKGRNSSVVLGNRAPGLRNDCARP